MSVFPDGVVLGALGATVFALACAPSDAADTPDGPPPVQAPAPSTDSATAPPSTQVAPPPSTTADTAVPTRPVTLPPRAGTSGSPAVGSRPVAAAAGMRSTLNGVYTEAQADKGEALYNRLCNSCHAPLQNHVGPYFRQSWGGSTLGDMMDYMVAEMPKNDPGSLSAAEYADVIAYLLKVNGMPAGDTVLAAELRALRQIRIDTAR